MTENKKSKDRKGNFSDAKLSVTKRYLIPFAGKRILYVGIAAGCTVLLAFFADMILGSGNMISNGPLSSNHANFESDCASCHAGFSLSATVMAAVQDNKCLTCHNNSSGDIQLHTFTSHYVYRSHDKRRAAVKDSVLVNETPCFACHNEHNGRDNNITDISDSNCLTCHQYNTFNAGHPQFQFAKEALSDNANLKFTHIFHVKEMQRRGKAATLEDACLACHQPSANGKSFQPLNFETMCNDCHLGILNPTATEELTIKQSLRSRSPGVKTVQQIQKSGEPNTTWAKYANQNEFDVFDGVVVKEILHHKDPWVMENLRSLRKEMFPTAGLADLLKSDGEVSRHESSQLYAEAIATLETYTTDLQSHPSTVVQEDLERVTEELNRIKKILRNPGGTQFDYRKFTLGSAEIATNFQKRPKLLAQYTAFVNKLTAECQTCHIVQNATILRVQKDQRTLLRAEFNHQTHVLQNGCLDCHQHTDFKEFANATDIPAEADNAAILNIPAIKNCQSCHTAEAAKNQCITCHQFHPNKSQFTQLNLSDGASW